MSFSTRRSFLGQKTVTVGDCHFNRSYLYTVYFVPLRLPTATLLANDLNMQNVYQIPGNVRWGVPRERHPHRHTGPTERAWLRTERLPLHDRRVLARGRAGKLFYSIPFLRNYNSGGAELVVLLRMLSHKWNYWCFGSGLQRSNSPYLLHLRYGSDVENLRLVDPGYCDKLCLKLSAQQLNFYCKSLPIALSQYRRNTVLRIRCSSINYPLSDIKLQEK